MNIPIEKIYKRIGQSLKKPGIYIVLSSLLTTNLYLIDNINLTSQNISDTYQTSIELSKTIKKTIPKEKNDDEKITTIQIENLSKEEKKELLNLFLSNQLNKEDLNIDYPENPFNIPNEVFKNIYIGAYLYENLQIKDFLEKENSQFKINYYIGILHSLVEEESKSWKGSTTITSPTQAYGSYQINGTTLSYLLNMLHKDIFNINDIQSHFISKNDENKILTISNDKDLNQQEQEKIVNIFIKNKIQELSIQKLKEDHYYQAKLSQLKLTNDIEKQKEIKKDLKYLEDKLIKNMAILYENLQNGITSHLNVFNIQSSAKKDFIDDNKKIDKIKLMLNSFKLLEMFTNEVNQGIVALYVFYEKSLYSQNNNYYDILKDSAAFYNADPHYKEQYSENFTSNFKNYLERISSQEITRTEHSLAMIKGINYCPSGW